jgi:hypothetical protein
MQRPVVDCAVHRPEPDPRESRPAPLTTPLLWRTVTETLPFGVTRPDTPETPGETTRPWTTLTRNP